MKSKSINCEVCGNADFKVSADYNPPESASWEIVYRVNCNKCGQLILKKLVFKYTQRPLKELIEV